MKYAIFTLLAIAVAAGLTSTFLINTATAPGEVATVPETAACTMDAMLCPDGSYVGRTGPSCQFVCPPTPAVPPEVSTYVESEADSIVLTSPLPGAVITSPSVVINGQARGGWFFEGSFPVTLTNWDGLIIAEGVAMAQGDWMTAEFVPFSATLSYTNPYKMGDQEIMKRGSLILKKDNPSGLPENDDALEIPVRFAP